MRSFNFPQNQTQTTFDWSALSDFYTEATPYFPVAVAGAIVWGLWLYRFILSRRARPIVTDFEATTSVIVPSFHEDPDILMSALESWREQKPNEIIIVLDVEDLEAYRRITALADKTIRPVLFHHVGKRSALGAGVRLAQYDILVLDGLRHLVEAGPARNVQMPFADPGSAASGTHQNVYQRDTSVWRRIADWLVNLRYLRLRAGDGPRRGGALHLGPDRGLPPRGRPAGPGAPGERVLPGPALHLRRRRPADLAGARLRLQDRAPVHRAGAVDVPVDASAPSSSSASAGAGTPTAAT